jgi:hypothetical protein
MDLENYRSSLDYREILRILQKASALQENFLWQTHTIGRTVIPVHHFEIDFVTREVVIAFDGRRFNLDPELPLYVKLDYRTSVFKVTEFRQAQNSVYFSFPVEIKTQELRTFPRHQFPFTEEKQASLKPSLTGHRDTTNELRVRVLDISQYGIGLLVSEQNRSYLKNNRILWLTKLGDHQLEYPILTEVVYMNNEFDAKFHLRKQKELKVGIKLSGVFPHDIYQKFIH